MLVYKAIKEERVMKKYKLNRKFFSVLLAGALVNTPAKAFAETVQADTEVPDGIEMT